MRHALHWLISILVSCPPCFWSGSTLVGRPTMQRARVRISAKAWSCGNVTAPRLAARTPTNAADKTNALMPLPSSLTRLRALEPDVAEIKAIEEVTTLLDLGLLDESHRGEMGTTAHGCKSSQKFAFPGAKRKPFTAGARMRHGRALLCISVAVIMTVAWLQAAPGISPLPGIPQGWYASAARPRSSFVIDPTSLRILPPHPLASMPNFPARRARPKKRGMVIPNAIHFTWMTPDATRLPLPFHHYLAIRSAMANLEPNIIYLHHNTEPAGPWWDELKAAMTMNRVVAPDQIYGSHIKFMAHKSDVIRLLALRELGGIYLDLDLFVLRPFDDLLYKPVTMGIEGSANKLVGLCNAVIIAQPNAPFLDRWLETYKTFVGERYNYNSVIKPFELALDHPEEIQVLHSSAFFFPLWDQINLVFEKDDIDFEETGQYAYHTWNSLSTKHTSRMTPTMLLQQNSTFARAVRRFVGPRDASIQIEWDRLYDPAVATQT